MQQHNMQAIKQSGIANYHVMMISYVAFCFVVWSNQLNSSKLHFDSSSI